MQKIEIWGGRAGTVASPGAAATIVASNTASDDAQRDTGSEDRRRGLVLLRPGRTGRRQQRLVRADVDHLGGTSCTLPGDPVAELPASGATGVATSPTLSWSAVSGATSYDLYLGTATTPAFYTQHFLDVDSPSPASPRPRRTTGTSSQRTPAAAVRPPRTRSFTTTGGVIPVTLHQ